MSAVPTVPPRIKRLRDSVLAIAHDCRPRLALTVGAYADFTRAQFAELAAARGLDVIAVDELAFDDSGGDDGDASGGAFEPAEPATPQAFLQYTSGSTGGPRA